MTIKIDVMRESILTHVSIFKNMAAVEGKSQRHIILVSKIADFRNNYIFITVQNLFTSVVVKAL